MTSSQNAKIWNFWLDYSGNEYYYRLKIVSYIIISKIGLL